MCVRVCVCVCVRVCVCVCVCVCVKESHVFIITLCVFVRIQYAELWLAIILLISSVHASLCVYKPYAEPGTLGVSMYGKDIFGRTTWIVCVCVCVCVCVVVRIRCECNVCVYACMYV